MHRNADKVLVLTPQGKKELLRFAPELDIAFVPHGVDVDTFAFSPDPQEPRSIVFAGNYLHEPNVDALLFFYEQVWPILKNKIPDMKF